MRCCTCSCLCLCFFGCHSERSEEPASCSRSERPFFPTSYSLLPTPLESSHELSLSRPLRPPKFPNSASAPAPSAAAMNSSNPGAAPRTKKPPTSSTFAWKPAVTSSTPPTSTPTATAKPSSAKPSRTSSAKTSSSPPRPPSAPARGSQRRRLLPLPPHRRARELPQAPQHRLHRRLPPPRLRRDHARSKRPSTPSTRWCAKARSATSPAPTSPAGTS